MNKPILFFDCGDTIIDEGTEIKNQDKVSVDAALIPGADELIKTLYERGYKMSLVADGYVDTFKNLLGKYDLYDYFDYHCISQNIGVCKPSEKMFHPVLNYYKISEENRKNVWMVGNNLERDVKGANALGLTTVWLDWAPRRSKTPKDELEKPDITIKTPLELLEYLK